MSLTQDEIRVLATAGLKRADIARAVGCSRPNVTRALGPLIPTPAWRVIVGEVSNEYQLPLRDMMSRSCERRLTRARQEAMYRIAAETPLSLVQIGRRLHRHHTTVLFGIRAHSRRWGVPLPRP